MAERSPSRFSAVTGVYLIVALFAAIILAFVLFIQFQMDAAVAIRVYVGGEGLWAKAQKDAVLSLERYATSRDEADYRTYQRLIQVPLGDRTARIELQKREPDLAVVRAGYRQGGLHAADIEYAIPFFLRFQHTDYLSRTIEHWSRADALIAELMKAAEEFHEEIAGGRAGSDTAHALRTRLADINRRVTEEENLFSATLAEASRWANDVSRTLTYATALLFTVLGLVLSWPIIQRIRFTEAALIESEGRYRGIFEQVSDVIYIVAPDGMLTSVNPACKQMAGWLPAELVGRPFADVVHPDDLPHAAEVFRQTLAGQATAHDEVRLRMKSGEYFNAEQSIVPLGIGSSVAAVLGIVRDVSARKRMEEQLRESEQRLRTILDTTVDGILVANAETRKFVIGNRAICEMLGYAPEELYGLGVQDIHPTEALPEVQQAFERQLKGEIRVAQNLPVKRKDGTVFLADVSSAPITLAGQLHLVGAFHDVSERKRAEQALQITVAELTRANSELQALNAKLEAAQSQLLQSEKMASIGLLAAGVAHEINNPVGYIRSNLQSLGNYVEGFRQIIEAYSQAESRIAAPSDCFAKVHELKQAIDFDYVKGDIGQLLAESNDGIERVIKIVRDLKDFSRVDAQEAWREEDIHQGLESTLNVVWNQLKYTCEVRKEYGVLPPVQCLLSQLNQVFMNILVNAAQAIPERGTVTIRTGVRDDRVWIEIADTGKGIAPENLQRIFDPFFTTKPVGKGTGLGLSVSYSIVQKHHGTIEVESEPDRGTTFRIWLPVRQPPPGDAGITSSAAGV